MPTTNAGMQVWAVTGPGLYQIRFESYEAARKNLDFLGWVEQSRTMSSGTLKVTRVVFFNRLVGGDGHMFPDGDDGWVFLAVEGWLMAVYKKLRDQGKLRSPSEDARVKKAAEQSRAGTLDLFGEDE